MAKNKLERYAAIKQYDFVFEASYKYINEDFHLKNKWAANFFINNNPIVLELGCGKGEYSLALAEKYSNLNLIGVDIKGDRIWKGAKTAYDKGRTNIAFLRTQIQFINHFFGKNEVDEIWLTFPDPQLQKPKHRKRLSSPEFLNRYGLLLKENGIIHLKTDNTPLFEYTLEVVKKLGQKILYSTSDLYKENIDDPILNIKTHYEKLFSEKGEKIKYLKFQLKLNT